MNNEFEHHKRAYKNYIMLFYPKIAWTDTIYKDLYNTLTENLHLAKVSLGDYYFKKYILLLNDNLRRIEVDVNEYAKRNKCSIEQTEYLFYHKTALENTVLKLVKQPEDPQKGTRYSLKCILTTQQLNQIFNSETFNNFFECSKEDFNNFFSEENIKETTKIKIKTGKNKIDIIHFLNELHSNNIIRNHYWTDVIVKSKSLFFQDKPLTQSQIKNSKRDLKIELNPDLKILLKLFLPRQEH